MSFRGRHSGIAFAVVIGLLLTSCAAGSDGSPDSSGSPAAPSPSTGSSGTGPATTGPTGSSSAATTPGPPPASTKAPEDIPLPDRTSSRTKGRTITVTGTVEAGVEGSCVLLGQYLLLGGPRTALKPGNRVTVTGTLAQGLVTTCQQGTPLAVERVTRTK